MERRLIEKSLQDDAFRQRLLEDPKAAVEEELGTRLPEQVRVVAVEETADTIYLVLPFRSTDAQEASELSNQELETVAGGAPAVPRVETLAAPPHAGVSPASTLQSASSARCHSRTKHAFAKAGQGSC